MTLTAQMLKAQIYYAFFGPLRDRNKLLAFKKKNISDNVKNVIFICHLLRMVFNSAIKF